MKFSLGVHTTIPLLEESGYTFAKYKGGNRMVFNHKDWGSLVFKPYSSRLFGRTDRDSKGQVVFVTEKQDGKA